MTISAVDTYFGDRFAGDFEQKFHTLEEEPLGNILAAVFQIGSDGFERTKFARALQHSEPSGEVVRLFRVRADQQTYQEPGVIAQEAKRFGVRNLWGDVDHRWRRIYGSSIRCESRFRDWAGRRHAIAHRAGRSRKAQRARSTAEHVSGDEARDCVNFFARLISLVDYQLNDELYGRQPRRRQSEIAVFDLEPMSPRRTFVPRGEGSRAVRQPPSAPESSS